MEYAIATLASLLFISLSANAYFYRRKPLKSEPRLDVSASDLLHDLTRRGTSIVKIEVVDVSNLLLRSPKQW